MFDYCGF